MCAGKYRTVPDCPSRKTGLHSRRAGGKRALRCMAQQPYQTPLGTEALTMLQAYDPDILHATCSTGWYQDQNLYRHPMNESVGSLETYRHALFHDVLLQEQHLKALHPPCKSP